MTFAVVLTLLIGIIGTGLALKYALRGWFKADAAERQTNAEAKFGNTRYDQNLGRHPRPRITLCKRGFQSTQSTTAD